MGRFGRAILVAPLFVIGLAAGLLPALLGGQPSTGATQQAGWTILDDDGPANCPPTDAGRDVNTAWYRLGRDQLALRVCLAGAPGWPSAGGAVADARYKWRIETDHGSFLLMLEDRDVAAGGAADSDGMGELTLLDDPNGNGRFSDDWASSDPPAYLNNAIGSPAWRRIRATSGGAGQSASGRGLSFTLGVGTCGPVVDMTVDLALIGNPSQVCAQWGTDDEARSLDGSAACDSGARRCFAVNDVPTNTPVVIAPTATKVPPTRTPTLDPPTVVPPATAEPTDTDVPPTATRTATRTATPEPTDAPPTVVPPATAEPTDTDVPPTDTRTATRTATPEPTDVPPTPTDDPPTATRTATPAPTDTDVPPTATHTAVPPTQTSAPTATQAPVEPPATVPPTSTPGSAIDTPTVKAPSATVAVPTLEPTPTSPVPSPTGLPSGTATASATSPLPTPNVATATRTATAAPVPVVSATATTGGGTSPGATPTRRPGTGSMDVQTVAFRSPTTQGLPGPFPATVYAVLLTPWGTPAMPPVSMRLLQGSNGYAHFYNLEPGQYRVWMDVPVGWNPIPGTGPSQYLWIQPNGPNCQALFQYQACSYCPNGGPGGLPPVPPGPPTLEPPGGFPTPPAPPTFIPPPPTPRPIYNQSPDRPNIGAYAALPILGYLGNDQVCDAWIEAQNVGDRPAKVLVLVWGAPGFCPPQCAGPLKVECSGLLAPGSTWNFLGAQLPSSAKSGMAFSANTDMIQGPHGQDYYADALCETLFETVVGNCHEYRRFFQAFTEGGFWNGFNFHSPPCQPIAVEVLRKCPGDLRPEVNVAASYEGVAGEWLGKYDSVYGGYAFFAPSLYAAQGGFNSILYIQNAGLECSSIEIWFKAQDDCLRSRICDIATLAPGETYQFDVGGCMPAGWYGSSWVRSTQPLAIAVDHVGNDVLMTYNGTPSELNYVFNGEPAYTVGSQVAYGPLVYSEYQGWDTAVIVQNESKVAAAKVKIYFQDRSGGIITTVADWVCAGGSQTFFLPVIADLPGHWVGSIRAESQDWFSPGAPNVRAPNIVGVAQLVKYSDATRTSANEAIAYNLFPEQLAYDWQLGSGPGGTYSGIGRIGIPSFLKDYKRTGVTTEIAIANIVPKPGFTNFAIFIYDQNGLIDYLCEMLSEKEVEYINLQSWGFINSGFKGSAIISATFWEHDVFDPRGGFTRNVVGLAAVKVERVGTVLDAPIPGDEASGNMGFPIPGAFAFAGPYAPGCPGQPAAPPPSGGPAPTPGGPPPPPFP